MSNDDYIEHYTLFYDQKVKFLSQNPIHTNCVDCDKDKIFEENDNKLLLSCGDDKDKDCSIQFIVNLPKYIHKDYEIESFKEELKSGLDGLGYNFDILHKYDLLKNDLKDYNDHKENILNKIDEIRKKYNEVNLKHKSDKINKYFDNRVELLNESNRTLHQIKNNDINDINDDTKKTLREKYVGIIIQLNSENQEVKEFINEINPYIMMSEPSVEIVDEDYINKLKPNKDKRKSKNTFYQSDCEKLMCSEEIDIHDRKEFYEWAKKNHPDKNITDDPEEMKKITALFQDVKNCHEDKEWCPHKKKKKKDSKDKSKDKSKEKDKDKSKEKDKDKSKEKDKSKDKKDTKSDDVLDLPDEIPVKKKDVKPKKKSLTIKDFKKGMKVEWIRYGKIMTGKIGDINKRKKNKIEVIWENGNIEEVKIDKLKIIE